jgi:acyl-CoA thioester hydrolase
LKIRVYYEDTDAGGIVYHSKYINFCERARSEILFAKGLSPKTDNAFFVVRDLKAIYLKSAKLGEILEVKTGIKSISKVSLTLVQEIFNEKNEKIFAMDIKLVWLKDLKPSKIDEEFLEIFRDSLLSS